MVSLTKPPFGVTTRQEKVAMICPGTSSSNQTLHPGSLTIRLWKMVVGCKTILSYWEVITFQRKLAGVNFGRG